MSKKTDNKPSRHHIIPKSRGGGGLENIAGLKQKQHRDYHTLFSNKTPEEIISYLVNDYWNGQWYHVDQAYKKRNPKY